MGNYYFAGTIIPEYSFDTPPDFDFATIKEFLRINLSQSDYAKTIVIRRYFDIENIRRQWLGKAYDPYGNLDENALEEALLTRTSLPNYVFDYIDKYEDQEERLKHFSELLSSYYREEMQHAKGFLKEFLIFEREMRLVLIGFRAKELGRDVALELQYEDPNDEIVAQIMAQKDSPSYEPPTRFEQLKPMFEQYAQSPLQMFKALQEFRCRKFEEMIGLDVFSIDRILGYMVEHILVEKWFALSRKQGHQMIETIVEEAS